MTIHPQKMERIWDKRISLIRDRIQILRQKGFTSQDEDLRELYGRLKFFEECKRHSMADWAWVD